MYDDSRPRNHIEAGAQLISATNAWATPRWQR